MTVRFLGFFGDLTAMMRVWLAVAVAAVLLGGGPSVRADSVDAWGAMAMLEGTWREVDGTVVIDEVWTNNRGNVITGMSRTINGLRQLFEFRRIENRKEGIVFIAQPGGDEGTAFRLVKHDAKTLVFANAANDWPKRIEYRRTGADVLEASVGDLDGKSKTLTFKYVRVR